MNVVLGGTFDHLHAGHKALIDTAIKSLSTPGRLIIGLSGPDMLVNKAFHKHIQSFDDRKKCLQAYVTLINPYIGLRLLSYITHLVPPFVMMSTFSSYLTRHKPV